MGDENVPSQQLILSKVHPLYYISTVIEHSTYVLCINSTGEVWVAVMSAIPACCTYPLEKKQTTYLLYETNH